MSLNIYFAGSIRGGRNDADLYHKIIEFLGSYGKVLTEHVGAGQATLNEELKKDPKFIHDRDMDWLEKSDVLVAEVTQTSLGVGYEIGRAVDLKKPIICLYRPQEGKSLSCMIRGADNGSTFRAIDYKENEYETILKEYFDSFKK